MAFKKICLSLTSTVCGPVDHKPELPSTTAQSHSELSTNVPSNSSRVSRRKVSEDFEKGLLEDNDDVLSTGRLFMAHLGRVASAYLNFMVSIMLFRAALTLFLATTDATIVSTSLPSIASSLGASASEYTWIGAAYLLTQTSLQPLYGRLSDILGRKIVLYGSMLIFTIGSLLCGSAKTPSWLIAARAFAGIGGGGIVACVWVLTSDLVPVERRARWSQALSLTWSSSAVAGPLLGGLFSGHSVDSFFNWRWGFYLNLPVCLIASIILLTSLRGVNIGPHCGSSWSKIFRSFDFMGLVTFMSGTTSILLGLSFSSEHGWSSPFTLCFLIFGSLILSCGVVYELYLPEEPLFPLAVFKDRTASSILFISFLHNFVFNAGTFYLALFYQIVTNSTPLEAGLKSLSYSLGSSLASLPTAWFIEYWETRTGSTSGQSLIIRSGLMFSSMGFGLMGFMDEKTSLGASVMFPFAASLGIGMLFHTPYQVFLRALKPDEAARGTGGFFLCRFTGATAGLAVAGAIFQTENNHRLRSFVSTATPVEEIISQHTIQQLPPDTKSLYLHAISLSFRTIWLVCVPLLACAFGISFLIKTIKIDSIGGNKKCEVSSAELETRTL